ncbi:titin homolog [Drosophila teissieri]|uniref:titin homolog n=1 Tax=Drosophila teissieri TaxID=7243 RepID=UPI001CBA1337|nr:titin homolog [Drosophila teissieri]
MSLDGARLRYEDENGKTVVLAAKGRSFQVGSYYNCDLILEGPEEERLICEINCDAFGRVIIYNKSSEDPIHLNDAAIHAAGKRPLLHGGKITIRDKVYTWEFPKSSELQEAPCTPERQLPNEQASNSCPSLKQSHRLQAEKRLTVHNFHYSINSDDEGNTSIESRDQNESHLEEVSLNESIPPTTEETPCESPKVNLLESTQNKENTATPPGSHQKLLKLCAMSDVVITSFSPRETGVKIEKSFTCVRKPGYTTTSLAVSTPKSVYSTPKGGVLSELNEDSCSRDLMDFSTPSTSKKTKRESSMFLIDLTTPSKLRQTPQQTPAFKHTPKQTPISVDSTDESSDASPLVIDITNSDTPPSPSPSQRYKTPQRQAGITGATPKRTPQSLMKRALLTSTKKQIAANQPVKTTPVVTPKRPSLLEARRHCLTTPRRLPFHPQRRTPVQREGQARGNAPKTSPRKRISLMESPRENKVSQLRKSFAAAKRSPGVDKSNKLVAKARRSLNSPKCGSPKPGSSMPSSPCSRKAIDVPQINSSTPEKPDDSKDELSRTFTIMDDTQGKDQSGAVLAIEAVTALVTGEVENDVSFQLSSLVEKGLPSVSLEEPTPVQDKVELIGPETDAEGKEDSSQDNLNPKPDRVIIEENECELDSFVKNELETAKSQAEGKQEDCDLQDEEEIVTLSTTVDKQLEEVVIEDSICEEVHANIPEQTHQNGNSEKVIEESICEELPLESRSTGNSHLIGETSQKKDQHTPNADTPVVRRSLRRLSVEQRATATTPRRSTRRSSMEASSKPLPENDNKRSRRASCSAMDSQDVVTPRRKRRFTQEMSTPTRQSMRLLNTPKRTLQVDESVGDMGVILEEVGPEDDNKSAVADDENYGNELPADDIDKVDYHGLRDLLKTPKSCSTPRFKGLREMMRTPKIPASPILGNMAELLETSVGRTPYHERRSIAVARMEHGKQLDNVLKTPSARNIMVPNEPASAVLKSREDSLATTTEYDLNMTNNTLHLDKIFDDVPETTAANMEDTETEINVTTISNATGVDPLGSSKRNETVTSEALMSVGQTATTRDSLKDPLTSTTYKATMQANPNLSAFAECGSRSFSPNPNEMSGIQLLDQTSDSMFSEALVVSAVESCEVTVDETRALGQTKPTDNIEDRSDTDSNVGLTEPLVFSDDEEPKEAEATPKKSDGAQNTSTAHKLEESVDLTENKTANETLSKYENDAGTISEISLIEVEDSTIEGSTCDQYLEGDKLQERNTLYIESAKSDNTESPLEENIKSAVVDSTILESEVFPLDTTADSSINSTNVPNSSLEKTIPDHDLKQENCKSTSDAQATAITSEKSFTNKREVNTDEPPIEISPKELDDDTSKPPIKHSKELSEESGADKVSTAEEFPLDTTADSSINSTNVLNSSLEKTLPEHDLKQENCKSTSDAQATAITSEKSFTDIDRSVVNVSPFNKREVNTDEPPIEISPNELDDETSKPPIEHSEELSEESGADKVSTAEEFPLDTTADSSINSTNVLNSSLEKTLPEHDLKQENCKSTSDAQATAITSEKSFTEISSKPPIEHSEEISEESEPDKASTAAESDQPETLPSQKDSPAESKQPFTESHSDELVQETNCNEVSIDGEVIKPAIETLPFVEQKQVPDVSTDAEPYQHCIKSSPLNEEKNQTDEVHSSVNTDQEVEPYPVKDVLKEAKADEPIQPVIKTKPMEELQEEARPDEAPTVSDSPVKGFIETKADDNIVKPIIETSPRIEPPEEACPDEVSSVSESDKVAIEGPPAETLSVEENTIDKTTKPTIEVPDLSEIDQLNMENSPAEELPEKEKPVETIQPIIETSPGDKDQIEASPTEVSSASKMDNVVVETNPQTDEIIPPDEIKICGQVYTRDTSISNTIDGVSDIDRDKIQDHHSTQNLSLNSSSEVQCVSKAEESLNNSTAAFEIEHSEDVVHATTSIDADISKKSEEEKMETVPIDVGCANHSSIACVLANVVSDGDASKAVSKDKDELEISTNSSKIPPSCTQDSLKTSLSVTSTSQDESGQKHVVLEESSNEIMAADKENSEKNKENISDDTLSVVEQTSVEQTSLIHHSSSLTDQNTDVSIMEESEAVAAEESMECQANKDSKTEVIQLDASTIVEQDTLDESTSVIEDIDQSTEITTPEEVSDVDKIKEANTMDKEESTESQHSDQKDNDDEVILLDASSLDESCTEPSGSVHTHADMEMVKNEGEKCNQSQSDDEVILLDTSSIVDQCSLNEDSLIQDQIEDTIPQGILIQANDAKESVSEEPSNQNGVTEKVIQLDSSIIVEQSICNANSISEDSVTEPATEKEICPKILTVNAAASSPHHLESQKSDLKINQIEDLPEDTTSASAIGLNSSSANVDLLNVSSARDIEFPISKVEDKPKDVSDAMADAQEAPTEAEDAVMQESDILITSSHTDELDLHRSLPQTENVSSEDVQSAKDGHEVEEVEIISEENENIVRAAEQKAQPGDPATCSSNSSIGQAPESTAVEATSVIPHEDPADVNQKETDEFKSSISSSKAPSANEPQVVVTIEESADVTKTSDGEDATNNLQEKDNIPMEPDTVQEQEDGTHIRTVSEDTSAPAKTESTSAVGSDQEMLAIKDDAGLGQPNAEDKPSEEPIHSTSTDSKSKERPVVIHNKVEIPTSEPTISPEPTEMSLPNRRSSNQEEKSPHEEDTKPIKRVTRKGSASADRPAEVERPKRVARKPSAEVLEIEDRARDTKQDVDLSIKSRGRARKPPSDVNEDKAEVITEKRRGRTRTPSVEVTETTANVEPKENDDDIKSEEALQPILEEVPEPEVEERIESNAEEEIIIDKPKKRLRKATSKESDTLSDNIEKINTDLEVVKEAGSTHSNNTEQRDDQDPIVLPAKSEVEADLEGERDVQDTNLKQTTIERPKRRGRKASAETDTASEKIEKAEDHLEAINEDGNQDNNPEMERQVYMAIIPNTSNEEEKLKTEVLEDVEPNPKRRVRKASAKETNTTSPKREKTEDILAAVVEVESALSSKHNSSHSEQMGPKEPAPVATSNISKEDLDPDNVPNVSSEKRVQKESTEDKSIVPDKKHKLESRRSIEKQDDVPKETGKTRAERPKRRGRKQSDDIVESSAPNDAHSPETEKALVSVQEDNPNPADQDIPKKRARKSAELKHATVEEHAKEDHVERPKRRGRKPSVDIDHVAQDVLEKPRRRGRTPAEHESHHLGDEKQEPVVEPAKKTRRIARKASAETVEVVSSSGEEHLQQIDEATEPVAESETAPSELIPQEGEEHKTRRRGRKPTVETVEGSIKNTPTEEPVALPTHSRRRGRKATEDEALTTADLAEPKAKVRIRRASLEPEHKVETSAESHQSSEVVELPAAKTTRRGRKPSADIEATSPEKKPPSRRVRKASASVDEEPPAAKKTANRRGRKNEAHEDEEKKLIDLQDLPTEIVSALVVTSGNPSKAADEEELTPRRREGRNLPRKNYEEAPDDDKPHSGLRRARKPAASKALANKASESDPLPATPVTKQPPVKEESTPDNTVSLPEPTTSQRREGRNLPRKNYTEAPDDDKPTPARSRRVRNLTSKALELIVDSSPRPATPKRPKGKGVDVEEPPAKKATPEIPSTTETSGPEEEPVPATKGRGTRRKADHSDLEEPEVKTAKKNVRGAGRKTKVETETEEHPPIKKPRGGSRAKTPSEEVAITLEEEPVKKPAARSRAKGAKAAEPEQPAEDPQVEVTSSKPAPAARGGRGRKVHFEAAPETSASESAPSSQRATRSRRK